MKSITILIKIPIKIITPMLKPNRKNSFFYAGKNIAKVEYRNTEYVLTTAGEYVFTYKSKDYQVEEFDGFKLALSNLSELTDTKIRKMDERGDIENWGWFGINVWIDGKCQDYPTATYTEYDEALTNFRLYVKQAITHSERNK